MALYLLQDLDSTFGGDLELTPNGDLQLADSMETVRNAANFLLRTDHGDYAPNPAIGANLGNLVGESMTIDLQESAESMIEKTLASSLLSNEDVRATVVPIDIGILGCFVDMQGSFLIGDEIVSASAATLAYEFPYLTGSIEPVLS